MSREVYLEISPLIETQWTGIPRVAAELARCLLGCRQVSARFFLNNQLIGQRHVERYLRLENGAYLRADLGRGLCQEADLPVGAAARAPGLFPNTKSFRRRFGREGQVIHDLSTILTPEFHTPANIRHHAAALVQEVQTNDMTFCVSEATRQDVVRYLGVPEERTRATPLGVDWPAAYARKARDLFEGTEVEPYVLCLGTLEPRKNLSLVFRFLCEHSWLLKKVKFVFVGRKGWLMAAEDMLREIASHVGEDVVEEQLVLTGYADRFTVYSLLEHARFLVYPSCFEGFGLPVLEAMSVGCPVLTSYSSSLPEVGGDTCEYFDPYSLEDFTRGFWRIYSLAAAERGERIQKARERAQTFTWERFFAPYLEWMLEDTQPDSRPPATFSAIDAYGSLRDAALGEA